MKYKLELFIESSRTPEATLKELIRDKVHELADVLIGIITIEKVEEWMKRKEVKNEKKNPPS